MGSANAAHLHSTGHRVYYTICRRPSWNTPFPPPQDWALGVLHGTPPAFMEHPFPSPTALEVDKDMPGECPSLPSLLSVASVNDLVKSRTSSTGDSLMGPVGSGALLVAVVSCPLGTSGLVGTVGVAGVLFDTLCRALCDVLLRILGLRELLRGGRRVVLNGNCPVSEDALPCLLAESRKVSMTSFKPSGRPLSDTVFEVRHETEEWRERQAERVMQGGEGDHGLVYQKGRETFSITKFAPVSHPPEDVGGILLFIPKHDWVGGMRMPCKTGMLIIA